MSMKKKLFTVFGPLVCSAVLLVVFFFAPFRIDLDSKKVLADASTSMATNVLRGDAIKNKAMASKKYVPFFGSSELSRISPFHPSVLAEKYNRNYRPFLLGAPGTQSLTQAMMMHSMGKDLANKKVVFILSPQWFVKNGVSKDYFNAYYSELQTYQWVDGLKNISEGDRYFAERLMAFPKVQEDIQLMHSLTSIKNNQLPDATDKHYVHWKINMLAREDELFSKIGMISKQPLIDKQTHKLPSEYNPLALDQLAEEIGAKATDNNQFEISNGFYKNRLEHHLSKLEGSQKDWDYRFSPEYSDLQLALEQLAKQKADVLFVIPPVNERWSDFTGLSQDMLQGVAKKLTYQLQSQGFNNIADFSKEADVNYFMADTIHLGWRGWLAVDEKVQPFIQNQSKAKPSYQLNDTFYSKDWQQQSPDDIAAKAEVTYQKN